MVGSRGHALVVGGSMAGLLAARVLADRFGRVTVVERDALPDGAEFRAGVPQSRHLHILLAKGLELLDELFPGVAEELKGVGAETVDWPADVLWLSPFGWSERFSVGLRMLSASREVFEWSVRRRVAALPNVRMLSGREVTGLVTGGEQGREVRGVRVRERGAGKAGNEETGETVEADLVVDASGRESRAPRWLDELGYGAPPETVINAKLGYASRYYERREDQARDWKGVFVSARPDSPRSGVLFPIEGDRWLVTLIGYGGDHPPTDERGFLEFARSIRDPILYEVLKDAKPISPVRGYLRTENRWRHYERLKEWPEGLLVTGDAACAFNPVYGQGMTAAALAARVLERCLEDRSGTEGLGRRFQRALAKSSGEVWLLATGEDMRYPTTEGARPDLMTRAFHKYLDRVMAVAMEDTHVHRVVAEVLHLLQPPGALMRPGVVVPAIRGNRVAARVERPTIVRTGT